MLAPCYDAIKVTKAVTINSQCYVNRKKAVCKRNGVNYKNKKFIGSVKFCKRKDLISKALLFKVKR